MPELTDKVCRFLFDKGKEFTPTQNIVHARAFWPRQHNGRLELSVCDAASLSENQIWEAGVVVEKTRAPKTLKARADFRKQTVNEVGLQFDRDDVGFSGHSNILGWSDDEEKQQDIASDLARQSELVIRP
jgi:hypothetical protein